MGDLSKHFNRSEFACKCGCGFDTVDYELIVMMEDVRVHFGKPITVTSGCRCKEHNKRVGGASKSMHITGKAADFKVKGVTVDAVHDYCLWRWPEQYGIAAKSGSFTHLDSRAVKARWSY